MTCDPCREGRHDDCIEKDFVWDYQGVDRRVCYCPCADEVSDNQPSEYTDSSLTSEKGEG